MLVEIRIKIPSDTRFTVQYGIVPLFTIRLLLGFFLYRPLPLFCLLSSKTETQREEKNDK
jgi:hypothetical protein